MEVIKLKNGTEEAAPLVTVGMMALKNLFETRPIHFFELVSLARNSAHVLFGKTGQDLLAQSLVQDAGNGRYTMHDSLRNIVLSAVVGEGLEMRLWDPRAD